MSKPQKASVSGAIITQSSLLVLTSFKVSYLQVQARVKHMLNCGCQSVKQWVGWHEAAVSEGSSACLAGCAVRIWD